MSGKERSLLKIIFKNFIATLKPTRHKLIGEDYFGTKYYEIERQNSTRKYPPRYFVPVNEDDHSQEVPVEWQAWLRYRRKDPPTKEEVEENYKLQMLKKQNAAEIEAKYSINKTKEVKLTSEGEYKSFPTYDDYINQDYEVKYNKKNDTKAK